LVYCTEASICGTINQNYEAMAAQSNLKVVLRKVTSITAPDYTSECQALKSAGAQMVFYSVDGSGDGRMARSCRALDYSPPVATAALAVSEAASTDPNLRAQGVFLGTPIAPFKADDVPGMKEFQEAYNTYAPGSSVDEDTMSAWASGKLFEKALANVSQKARSGPITKDLILEGLWKVKDETLDGIAPPITFNRDGLPSPNDCYFTLTIHAKGYEAPRGSKIGCFKGLPKGF
jgi:branched-chain amino acid transport system substrate-binding protein